MPHQNKTSLPSLFPLRMALGYIYFHFGFLKFFPDLSPAEMLASQTIMRLPASWLDAHTAMRWLAILECVIGLGFLFNVGLRYVSVLFFFHMLGTFTPIFLLPELAFTVGPLGLTLEGQYILKNLVFVAAGWTVLLPHCWPRRGGIESQVQVAGNANHTNIVETA